jgi:hypothetical protein
MKDVERDLAMVQVLGRIALSLGLFAVAGVGGWLASVISYERVFLLALIVPVISVTGALTVKLESPEGRAIDWRILGGGLAFGAFVTALGIGKVPFGQEIVFMASMVVVITMLARVTSEVPAETRARYRWFTIDVLGFNEAFQGTLNQIGALLALAGGWLLADFITRQKVTAVMLWLTLIGSVAALPNLLLVYGGYKWTERTLGLGAHGIALIDTAAQSPLVQLSLIPMLTLIAIYAPAKHRATWFALMASLMNLALVAGQLQTKYLTQIFVVARGHYEQLPPLALTTIILGLIIPLAAIIAFGHRVERTERERTPAGTIARDA